MSPARRLPVAEKKPSYFWWILAHAIAICFCAISWIVTNYIFNNPELPRNYEMLKRMGQAPVPELVDVLKAPTGDSLKPEQVYSQFTSLLEPSKSSALAKINAQAIRGYLKGFPSASKPRYIEGTFRVIEVRLLNRTDLFSPGFVVRAQAWVQPSAQHPAGPYPVMIECMIPSENRAAFSWFKPGDLMRFQKIPDCMSIIHISQLGTHDEPIINLTVTPLSNNEYRVGASRLITMSPPANLNLQAKFPLFENSVPKPP